MICAKEGKGAIGILKYMPARLYEAFGKMAVSELLKLEEIRIGKGAPVVVVKDNGCFYVTPEGEFSNKNREGFIMTAKEVDELFSLLCEGSVYAVEENLKKGFFTADGGHRIGVCGTYTFLNGKVESVRNISFINIRIAHEIIGAAEGIINFIAENGVKNTLVVSPPGGGKTTLLRDICRLLGSDGFGYKVAVADERGEIGAVHGGIPFNTLGTRTCIMDGCPKAVAMEMLLRCMGPDVIITDEIGDIADEKALQNVLRCGVKIITSAHGKNFEDVAKRIPFIKENFEKIIVLEQKKIKEVKNVGA